MKTANTHRYDKEGIKYYWCCARRANLVSNSTSQDWHICKEPFVISETDDRIHGVFISDKWYSNYIPKEEKSQYYVLVGLKEMLSKTSPHHYDFDRKSLAHILERIPCQAHRAPQQSTISILRSIERFILPLRFVVHCSVFKDNRKSTGKVSLIPVAKYPSHQSVTAKLDIRYLSDQSATYASTPEFTLEKNQ